jgi:hypothetical protein
MRRARHVARTGDRRNLYRVLMKKNLGERNHLENLGVDGKIILKLIFKTQDGLHRLA